MKVRYGFVTNSSSTSYVVAMKKDFILSTTDKKFNDLMLTLSNSLESLFEVMGRSDDDYSISYISDLNEFADYILNRYSYNDNSWRYKDLIFNTKGKTITRHEPLRNANEDGVKSVIKLIEGEYYEQEGSLIHWLSAIKKGEKLCIMKSSNHNAFICSLMQTISEAEGAYLMSRDNG